MKWKCSRVPISSSTLASPGGKAGGRADNWQRKGNGSTRANQKNTRLVWMIYQLVGFHLSSWELGLRSEKAVGWRRKPSDLYVESYICRSIFLAPLLYSSYPRSYRRTRANALEWLRESYKGRRSSIGWVSWVIAKKRRALNSNVINHWLFILYYSNFFFTAFRVVTGENPTRYIRYDDRQNLCATKIYIG